MAKQLSVSEVQGAKKFLYISDTSAHYFNPCSVLSSVVICADTAGTLTLVDQADANATDAIVGDTASSATVITIIPVASLTDPTYPRRLTVTPTGTTNDVSACSVTVRGTDVNGNTISEDFVFLANANTATSGSTRFMTVNEVEIPVQDGAGATFRVGSRAGDTVAVLTLPASAVGRPTSVQLDIQLEEGLAATVGTGGLYTICYVD